MTFDKQVGNVVESRPSGGLHHARPTIVRADFGDYDAVVRGTCGVEVERRRGACASWPTSRRQPGRARNAAGNVRCTIISRRRSWRHLDTCQYQTLLHARRAAHRLPEHGVRDGAVALGRAAGRFTLLFERLAIDWLQAASQQAVAERLGLSWDEMHGIMQRAVERGLKRREAEEIPYIGVDEKAFRKGHRYATLVTDLVRGRVLYVAEERKQSSLDGFWATLTPEQTAGIQGVAMDMWDAVRELDPRAPAGRRTRRSSTTSSTWPSTWARRSIKCAAQRTSSCGPNGDRAAGGNPLRLVAEPRRD